MMFSIYPTYTREVIESIVQQYTLTEEKYIYTSLHIPEAIKLSEYVELLKKLHEEKGVIFFADISPLTLKILNIELSELKKLGQFGVGGVRIDFGFSTDEIKEIIRQGFTVAVNASVVSEDFLNCMKDYFFVGWHNYYPRPGTGLKHSFFQQQSSLFSKYNIKLYTFIPGESNLRAPLYQGLPTLEEQRYQNTYISTLQMMVNYPNTEIVLAEGSYQAQHYEWIRDFCNNQVMTIPVTCVVSEEIKSWITNESFVIRVEESSSVFRLENTRCHGRVPSFFMQANRRLRGSLQMEKGGYGRYEGELSIMKVDMPLDINMTRIAEIPTPYLPIVDLISSEFSIKFINV